MHVHDVGVLDESLPKRLPNSVCHRQFVGQSQPEAKDGDATGIRAIRLRRRRPSRLGGRHDPGLVTRLELGMGQALHLQLDATCTREVAIAYVGDSHPAPSLVLVRSRSNV